MARVRRDLQYVKFCLYGFFKNLRFFDAFIILFFREMGFSFLEIGSLFAIREIGTNLLEIPTGIVADAYGRRGAMILAFASYIVSFVVFFLLPSYATYAGAMIFFALGEAFRTGTHKAMILEYLRLTGQTDLKVDYYGHTRAWSRRGSAFSSVIAAALVFWTGSYRVVFAASVVPYVLGLLLMASYPKALDGEILRREGPVLKAAGGQIADTLRDFASLFRNPGFLRVLFNSASFDGVYEAVKDYIQPVLQAAALALPIIVAVDDKQRVAVVTGLVYFLLYLLTSVASASAGPLARKAKSLPRAINGTLAAGAATVALTGLLHALVSPAAAILPFIALYVLHNVRRPLNVGYISDQISNRVMASGLSGESQIKALLVAVLAPAVGLAADRFGIGWALAGTAVFLLAVYPLAAVGRQAAGVSPAT